MWWRYLVFLVLPPLMAITAGIAFQKRRHAYALVSVGGILIYGIQFYDMLANPRPGGTWWAGLIVASWVIGILVIITGTSHWLWWRRRLRKRDDEGKSR